MTTLKRRLTRLQTHLWILFESGDLEAEKYKRKDVIITSSYMKIEQSVGFLELGCTLTRVESDKRGDKIHDLLLWNPFFRCHYSHERDISNKSSILYQQQ